jgi:hypothetical protein
MVQRLRVPPLHATCDRELVAELGGWELRQYAQSDPRRGYFAAKGYAHVQLWNPATRVSVLTPSRLTGGGFEVWCEGERFAASTWGDVAVALAGVVALPGRHELRAVERWFVLPAETRAGRLLRSWWAGTEESAR